MMAKTALAENSGRTATRRRGPGRPFQPGQTGNAGGRPKKDRQLTKALESRLDGEEAGKRRYDLVAEKVVALAIAGDMAATKFLADRTEGLPIQRHIFDPEDLRQQAEALAAETGADVEDVEPMLKRNLTLVK